MGKKAKFKKIRRFASQMPVISFKAVKGERISGAELQKEMTKDVEGNDINPELMYRKKSTVQQPLNHYRKMKKLYNKHGFAGPNSYAISVDNYIKQQNEKAKASKT